MTTRQAFVPRPPSRVSSSEPLPHTTDARAREGDRDTFVNGNGKARSIAAFLGQKRGTGTDAASQVGPTQGPGLGRANTSTDRRSFDGILRPQMTAMSIIPYPTATTQLGAGMKQPGAGQTPRKIAGPGAFEFARPMTPTSIPRGLKKGFGIFAENREDETTSDGNGLQGNIMFMGPEDEADVRAGTGAGVGGYMRVFDGSGSGGSADGLQPSLEHDIAAPVPGYALGGLGENPGVERCEIDGMFARSSRPLGAMAEAEASMEKGNDSQRSFLGTKRGMRREDIEESGRYTDASHPTQRSGKRMKLMPHGPNEYFPISSPPSRTPPTPRPPASSVDVLDPSLVVGSLLENMEEFVGLEDIEADWKRWRECTTEEWLKGADELAQDYGDILNMVKDHLTEKVLAYASMISSVEERRAEVNRNIEMIHGKGNIVRENISKLGTKK
ncbi:hypothetical protein HD554DRAFT_2042446 [Boletus coccyginus]|nr:hypothetical protein HD554DRAFT_2042446 [Boletus coccyginus]